VEKGCSHPASWDILASTMIWRESFEAFSVVI